MSYDPKGEVAKFLEPLLANELASTYGITEDAQDTAEYINDRIGQGKSASEICADVKDVVNIPIDEAFIGRVFVEIARLQQIHASGQPLEQPGQQPQAQQQQQQQQQTLPQQQQQFPQQDVFLQQAGQQTQTTQNELPSFAMSTPIAGTTDSNGASAAAANPFFPNGTPVFPQAQATEVTPKSFPSGPAKQQHQKGKVDFQKMVTEARNKPSGPKGKTARGGVGKDYDSKNGQKKKGRNAISTAALQRTLNLAPDDVINIQTHTQRPPKGRCPDFPKCSNRECKLAHPQKTCHHYPTCQYPPGVCDYLHPNEDQELMQEINKMKSKFQRRTATIVELCKFGVLCSKELCPFGHPTPANKHAKVMVQNWCRMNKNCTDENCEFAHSSPNYQAPAPVAAAPVAVPEKKPFASYRPRTTTSLEQCKFGKLCTSNLCFKRHNTSLTPCRAGYNCTRLTCTFAHPIMEDCRFGLECNNKTCYYKHPDNRETQHFNGGAAGDTSTMDRAFAVTEDQVMEQAVQQ